MVTHSQPRAGSVSVASSTVDVPAGYEVDPGGGSGSTRGIRAFLVVAGCALIGALFAGWLAGLTSSYAASTLVEAAPVVLGGVDQSDSSSTYVRTELLFSSIYAVGMNAAAAEATGNPNSPHVKVVLRSGTTVLFFDAQAPTAQDAATIANASSGYYVKQWRARTLESLNKSVAIIDDQLAGLPADSGSAEGLNAQRVDLQTQIASVKSAERIIGAATVDTATPSASLLGGAILGGLVGLVLGLGLVILGNGRSRRRRRGRPDQVPHS